MTGRSTEARHEAKLREVEDRRREKERAHAEAQLAHEESVVKARRLKEEAIEALQANKKKACPVCRREFAGATTYCPEDGAKLLPAREVEAIGLAGRDVGKRAPIPLPSRHDRSGYPRR